MKLILSIVALLALTACAQEAQTQTTAPEKDTRPDFTEALDAHLATIAVRDVDAFADTLTKGDDLYVIFPGGSALTTTESVIDFHEDWFADGQWRMDPTIVKIIEASDMATALLKYDYRDAPEAAPRSSWLVLVFKLEQGKWKLVHDQNTRIDTSEETSDE